MSLIFSTLTVVTFFPLVGVLALLLVRSDQKNAARWIGLATTLITFVVSLVMLAQFRVGVPGLQLEIRTPWFGLDRPWNIEYHLGLDGLNILLVLLTTFLTPIALVSAWNAIDTHVREFVIFFLLLEVGMTGVFLAQDLVLFYVFWEFTLIPMYFLIGIWGGAGKIYAAVKFFLYTMAGSVLMLIAIIWLGMSQGTFSMPDLLARSIPIGLQTWLFLAFAAAFAIKVPIWPLHSWLPDAHVEAPTAGSVILAGVMLKLGTYGLLRFNLGLFPQAAVTFAPWLAALAVIGIVYGAIVSYAQTDAKKLVAFSSVSHLGFVVLGLFALNPAGMQGALLQMVNHGLSTGALFLLVGMLYERRHTREMAEFGGLWKVMPVFGALMLIVTLSSLGLPGLNGFVGEFTILLGAWGAGQYGGAFGSYAYAVIGALGVILAAIYLLWMFQKVFQGEVKNKKNLGLPDLSLREIALLVPILVLIFWIGLYPQPFIDLTSPAINQLAAALQTAIALK
jgi:NADH-quinone oxidoreductase subunit M